MPQILSILAGAFLSIASAVALGKLVAARTPLPHSIRFVTGAAAYSLFVFVLLACHAGYVAVYILCAALLLAAAHQRAQHTSPLPRLSWFYRAVFAVYGVLYLVVALAPETQEDAAGYHLRIVSDYVRLHAFSGRVTFYDALPHGLEMLFVPAFALGAHSAAKLVHFAFLLALVPLIRELAREWRLDDRAGTAAAALLFLAPVSGVAGTSAYTDIGLVAAACAVLYLLVRWKRERAWSLLLCAGLNAGFCYAIKPSFGWIALPALIFVALDSLAGALLFAGSAALQIAPWLTRAGLLTGSPFAPLLNTWFPSPASTPAVERHLLDMYSVFRPDFPWWKALPAYTVTGGNQGLLGPAFLLLPLAVLALRRRKGRRLIACSLLLAVPFLANSGTRFLLPALVPATLALTWVLPAPVALAAVVVQAIAAAPPVLSLYEMPGEWRIRDVSPQAAFRMEPERDYLRRTLPALALGRLILSNTPPNARVFVTTPLPESYIPRELLFYWQSEPAVRMTDALHFAYISQNTPARLLSTRWSRGLYRSPRLTARARFTVVEGVTPPWQPLPEGQSLNVRTNPAHTGADLLIWPAAANPRLEALASSGAWQTLAPSVDETQCCLDVRRNVADWMRNSGYSYILIAVAGDAFSAIGMDMARHSDAWGLQEAGRSGNFWLFRISAPT